MRPGYAFIAFVLLLMLSGCAQQNDQLTEEKAVNFVKDDMKIKYPGATTSVFLVTQQDGSWKISSKVIYGAGTPCPNLSIVVYEYPEFGFVPREQNVITSNCEVLGCKNIPNCRITTAEQAVIASHKLNDIAEVNEFMNKFVDKVRVDAAFYESYYERTKNVTYDSVWVVRWNAQDANYSLRLLLNETGGKVLDTFTE
ncbi:MAG: hypothetical protein Sv326_1302 [Candidatus Fermentimicrarchaeum limneticum]|uniref:Lipoprotein n=1 Tax=Fermentimicrarchaeum limneticum TaxID=2795018 RepID=A0A7D6BB34_FERL1|nr:MAG: hypothetical protein Sv326_1302 [Candidatus Fermentimicrarchaeum limneticum]